MLFDCIARQHTIARRQSDTHRSCERTGVVDRTSPSLLRLQAELSINNIPQSQYAEECTPMMMYFMRKSEMVHMVSIAPRALSCGGRTIGLEELRSVYFVVICHGDGSRRERYSRERTACPRPEFMQRSRKQRRQRREPKLHINGPHVAVFPYLVASPFAASSLPQLAAVSDGLQTRCGTHVSGQEHARYCLQVQYNYDDLPPFPWHPDVLDDVATAADIGVYNIIPRVCGQCQTCVLADYLDNISNL